MVFWYLMSILFVHASTLFRKKQSFFCFDAASFEDDLEVIFRTALNYEPDSLNDTITALDDESPPDYDPLDHIDDRNSEKCKDLFTVCLLYTSPSPRD